MSLDYSHSSNTKKMLSIKIVLISTSVLSIAVMLKLSIPVIAEFTLSDLPTIWSFIISWLRPPYLYVVINCIIITIVATSRLQSKADHFDHPPVETAALPPIKHVEVPRMDYVVAAYDSVVPKFEPVVEVKAELENGYVTNIVQVLEPDLYFTDDGTASEGTASEVQKIAVNEFMISKPAESSMMKKDLKIPREKPPVSARIGHKRSVKAGPEGGRTLGVTKPKRQETLESTWKTITEGRPMPLTRHLKKSDTWETQGRHHHNSSDNHDEQRMTKSETINARNNPATSKLSRQGSGMLKKDPSLGQEELNKRVEAFIKKFNEDMRIQRQESLNQYMEMINRGGN